MKFRWLALSGLCALGVSAVTVADPASDATRHIKAGNYSAAVERLQRAAPFAKEQFRERFLYATALAGAGDHDKAIELFEGLIAEAPSYPEPYNNLAALYALQGRLDEAKDVLERAIRTDERYAAIYGNLSTIYVEMARASYAKALRVQEAPKAPDLRLLHAMAAPVAAPDTRLTVAAAPATEPVAATPPKPAEPEPVKAADARPADTSPLAALSAEPAPAAVPEPATPAPAASAPAPAAAEPTVPAASTASETETEIGAVLAAWAKAWAGQDVEGYLGFYAADFSPSRGTSRAQWEAQRRERLARPETIEISLENVQVRLHGADQASVRLVQGYRSSDYQDRTRKAFTLARRDGRWLIVSERTLQVLP
jgi:tetratricopeptide (TPR) repeat protein